MKTIKIAQVIPALGIKSGGPSRSVYSLSKGLRDSDVNVEMLTNNDPLDPNIADDEWIKSAFLSKRMPFGYNKNFKKLFAKFDYSLLHIHSVYSYTTEFACRYARHNKIPYIVTPRGSLYPDVQKKSIKKWIYNHLFLQKDLNKSAVVHATCKAEMIELRKYGVKSPIAIIPNSIEIPKILPRQEKTNKFRIGVLGRINAKKNIDGLIKAWNLAGFGQKNNCELVIVGGCNLPKEKEYLSSLKTLEKTLNIKNIRWEGFKFGDEKTELIRSFSYLVMPSHSENFGMSVIEALIQCVPVIASKYTPWEELEKYNAGWWINNTVESLADALNKAFNIVDEEREKMGKRGQNLVVKSYSTESVTHKLIKLYDWILSGENKPDFVYEYRKGKTEKVLCIYATRQIDSNLFMSSTIFNGLKQAGYKVDIVFMGYREVIDIFRQKYGHYFNKIYEIVVNKSWLARNATSHRTKLLYSFYLHFIKDAFFRPYSKDAIKGLIDNDYDSIVSFVPPPVSGLFASDIRSQNNLNFIPLIQFWTDPLSLGRCDSIKDIPNSRFMHRYLERRIISKADSCFFGYKLLCETEQKLYPNYAYKMNWTHISYIEHPFDKGRPHNDKITIGLFGAYQRRVRNIEPLLKALSHFPNEQFIIRGDADFEIDAENYPNLDVIYGRQPVDEIEKLESKCDILLSLAGLSGVTQPAGKTFYYANYNKPIVHIGDGYNKDYFANYILSFGDRWIICENKTESIIQGIKKAIEILPTFELHIPKCMEPAAIARTIIEYKK